jgi:exodeoxyribonuclease-3
MKIVSWNVNGLRSVLGKGFEKFAISSKADIILLQEIKVDFVPIELSRLGYTIYCNPAKRKGYSGVLSMCKSKPLSVRNKILDSGFDNEGRLMLLEYPELFVVNAYFPNSQHGLIRLRDKLKFDQLILHKLEELRASKPVVICGDFNVAHQEIDIARPKDNVKNPGFTPEERAWMSKFLAAGYIDTFRLFETRGGHYSWWSYRFNARKRNIGWRIDYCIVSEELRSRVTNASIMANVAGSDHAPVTVDIEV